jgi:hypothetical protein
MPVSEAGIERNEKEKAALRRCEHGRSCLGAPMRERDKRHVRAHAGVKTTDDGQNGGGNAATGTRTERGMND